MHRRAQTNLQLYAQVRELGYSNDELASVVAAYELAMGLFSGQYRGDGRPFVAHLVGTAGILAALRVPIALVIAGLLHAAYEVGDFGDGVRGIRASKRRHLSAVVGGDIEALVADYSAFRWNAETIASLAGRATALSDRERQLVLLRVANLLDELLDRGVLYSGKAPTVLATLDAAEHHLQCLTAGLGHATLAEALAEVIGDLRGTSVLPSLRHARAGSFVLAPASYTRRPAVRVRALLTRLGQWSRRRSK